MKLKSLVLAAAVLFTASAMFAAESYTVKSVTGKVQYEAAPGSWKNVTAGQKISSSTVVNTSLNSTLVVADGKSSITIKAMQKGTIESLSLAAKSGSNGIKKGTGLAKSSVSDEVTGSSKGVATASSRASEAKEDIDWDE